MNVLCIADIHGDIAAVMKAAEYAKKNGIKDALILGDFPSHQALRSIELSTKAIRDTFSALEGLKAMAIPGNCDMQDSPKIFQELGINLHEKTIELGGWSIAGFGGSNITPFDTPNEMDEEEIYEKLRKLLKPLEGEKTVLAAHCPPKDTNCDKKFVGMHVGSTAIRRVIEEYQPRLVLCSHIHEAGGMRDAIGGTLVVNIAPIGNGGLGVLSLEQKAGISLIKSEKPLSF